jgi:hypothetical protein
VGGWGGEAANLPVVAEGGAIGSDALVFVCVGVGGWGGGGVGVGVGGGGGPGGWSLGQPWQSRRPHYMRRLLRRCLFAHHAAMASLTVDACYSIAEVERWVAIVGGLGCVLC